MKMVQLRRAFAFTVAYPDETEKTYEAGETVTITPEDYAPDDTLTVTPDTHSGRIKLLSVTRECGNPEYDGTMELDVQDGYIYVINEFPMMGIIWQMLWQMQSSITRMLPCRRWRSVPEERRMRS